MRAVLVLAFVVLPVAAAAEPGTRNAPRLMLACDVPCVVTIDGVEIEPLQAGVARLVEVEAGPRRIAARPAGPGSAEQGDVARGGFDTTVRVRKGPPTPVRIELARALAESLMVSALPDIALADALPTDPVRITPGVTPPVRTQYVDPVSPYAAKRGRKEGEVILESVIDTEGAVTVRRILKSAAPDLDAAAVRCAERWRYEPARYQGRPQAVIMTVAVKFSLSR